MTSIAALDVRTMRIDEEAHRVRLVLDIRNPAASPAHGFTILVECRSAAGTAVPLRVVLTSPAALAQSRRIARALGAPLHPIAAPIAGGATLRVDLQVRSTERLAPGGCGRVAFDGVW